MLERDLENKLVVYAKSHGVYTRKFVSPAQRGVPDRVFLAKGRVLFLEVKRPGEEPTKLQLHEMATIRKHGGRAEWTDNLVDGMLFIQELLA